jgi:hypothetical protein
LLAGLELSTGILPPDRYGTPQTLLVVVY